MVSPDSQKEVWFEHKMGEGKVYYSNPINNQTTWERPQDAQIMSPPGPGNIGRVIFLVCTWSS